MLNVEHADTTDKWLHFWWRGFYIRIKLHDDRLIIQSAITGQPGYWNTIPAPYRKVIIDYLLDHYVER